MRRTLGTVALVVAVLLLGAVGAERAGGQPIEYRDIILPDNPTSWWRFEDPSSANGATAADSAGTADGTYMGGTTFVPGIAGQAAFFNPAGGGDQVRAHNVPMTSSVSMELWAQSATPTWNEWGWLAAERGPNGVFIHPDYSGSGTRYWRGFVVDNTGTYSQIGGYTPAAIDDRYHHYAVTFDDATNTGKVYFDGQLVATKTGMTLTRDATSTITLEIGRDDAGTRYGHGAVDEVQIYDRALDDNAVWLHYVAGAVSPYSALVQRDGATVHYRFDEGPVGSTPTTAIDAASRDGSQNGTYSGGAVLGPGTDGAGLALDGSSDYVSGSMSVNDSFSVEVWGKSATPTWNTWGWLASARSGNGFILHPDPGRTTWDAYVMDSGGTHHWVAERDAGDITEFHLYALTYDHGTGLACMYFDGDLIAQRTLSIARGAAPIPVYIGKDDGLVYPTSRFGNGTLDEFALFPFALTPEQVHEHYLALIPEPATLALLGLGGLGLLLRRCRGR